MMFCVVPEEMAGELYDRLVDYYEGDPNMEVIIDRRAASRRRPGAMGGAAAHRREVRDRRRPRVPGEFPPLGADTAA
jgi:hypothetical protein